MQSQILTTVKSLTGKSAIYSIGGIAMRAMGFFLLPIYTRYLTRADYGILAVTSIVIQTLTIIYPLGLPEAVKRFYFSTQNEEERRRTNGAIWLTMVVVALGGTVLLDQFGGTIFPLFFQEVPFHPYIRMAIWVAFFNAITLLPLIFFQVQERPKPYVFLLVAGQLLTYGLIVSFVVFQNQGAYSYIQGHFLAMSLLTVPYLVLTMRHLQVTLNWDVIKTALIFSLPLVPHTLAVWVLEFSDRIVLEHFVSLDELGLYSLGYTFGSLMFLIAKSVNTAWVPIFYKTAEQQDKVTQQNLPRLITYYALGLSIVALAQMLFIKELIILLTAPAFHAAYRVTPWIISGQLLNGLVYIPANFLLLNKKTKLLPVVTILSGVVNVGLNLWLVPYYGIIAAAWTTLLCYGLMLVLTWRIALHVHPIQYEYKRLGQITLAVICVLAASYILPFTSIVIGLVAKTVLLLAFPFVLILLGFFSASEKKTILSFIQQALAMLRQKTSY